MMAPRVTMAVWLAGAVAALAHHLHVHRWAQSAVDSHRFGHTSWP